MPATPDCTDNTYREFTAEQRRKLAEDGLALPDGSFPIETVDDLSNAIQAAGRAKDAEAAKAHIKKRARDLSAEDLIPKEWGVEPRTFAMNFTDAELAYGEWFAQRRKKRAAAKCAADGVVDDKLVDGLAEADDYSAAIGESFHGMVETCFAQFRDATDRLLLGDGVSPTTENGSDGATLSAANLSGMTRNPESPTDSSDAQGVAKFNHSVNLVHPRLVATASQLGAAVANATTLVVGISATPSERGPVSDDLALSDAMDWLTTSMSAYCEATAWFAANPQIRAFSMDTQPATTGGDTTSTTATSAESGEEFSAADATRRSASLATIQNDFERLLTTSNATFAAPEYIKAMNKPGTNWVEQEGGLPRYIEKIANHLVGKGMTEGHAIASAVNTVKRWARGGRVSEHGGGNRGASHVKPDTIAKAIVALAEWEIKKAAAHAHASSVITFAASTADEVAAAEADVPPEDVDTLSAVQDGFDYLTEWIADEANADDPAFDLVKKALDKVGPQLDELVGNADAKKSEMAADVATFAAGPEQAAPEQGVPEDGGEDPGEGVPLAEAQAEYAALSDSADSIVEQLTAEYNAALADLPPVD